MRPIAYYSKKMEPAERKYDARNKELLAIVCAVDHWRCYIDGSPHSTKILTDHKGLQWLNSAPVLLDRQSRWVEKLSDIEYEVHYVPGPRNAAADALSRRWDYEVNAGQQVATDEVPQPQAPRLKITLAEVQGVVTEEKPLWESRVEALTLRDELKKAAAADPWYREKLKETAPIDGLLRGDGLLWTADGRFYVPDDRGVQSKLLYEVHDAPTGGHMGERKTLHKLQSTCYWEGMRKDIEDYVRGCQVCAAVKPSQKAPAGLLQPLPIPHRPWEVITLDFKGPLPPSKLLQRRPGGHLQVHEAMSLHPHDDDGHVGEDGATAHRPRLQAARTADVHRQRPRPALHGRAVEGGVHGVGDEARHELLLPPADRRADGAADARPDGGAASVC